MTAPFQDRRDAGRQLAIALAAQAHAPGAIVLALPRGGVPVAFEVARALDAELDAFIVRKIGAPGNPELALGAVASGGTRALNPDVIAELGLSQATVEALSHVAAREVAEREAEIRATRAAPDLRERAVILVDDGLATGATMRAAVLAVHALAARSVTVAVPVAAAATCATFERDAAVDQFVCLLRPINLQAVGFWYRDFAQTTVDEVRRLIQEARQRRGQSASGAPR